MHQRKRSSQRSGREETQFRIEQYISQKSLSESEKLVLLERFKKKTIRIREGKFSSATNQRQLSVKKKSQVIGSF